MGVDAGKGRRGGGAWPRCSLGGEGSGGFLLRLSIFCLLFSLEGCLAPPLPEDLFLPQHSLRASLNQGTRQATSPRATGFPPVPAGAHVAGAVGPGTVSCRPLFCSAWEPLAGSSPAVSPGPSC